MKKKQITLILMCVCLVVVSVVYFTVIVPLANGGEDTNAGKLPQIQDGEGIYLNKISLYPEIDKNDVQSIEVENENGAFTFHRVWDEDSGKYDMKISGHEKLSYDATFYAYLISYTCVPSTVDSEPIRNLTEEEMLEYGVTEQSCIAKYTITYLDKDGNEQSYTVKIGQKAYSSDTTYYVAVDGRNSVYRMQSGVETSLLLSLEDYVTPTIFYKYTNAANAALGVKSFTILFGGRGTPEDAKPLLQIVQFKDNMTETGAGFNLTYPKRVLADTEYISDIFAYLYCTFSGESAAVINPTEEELNKYGFGEDDNVYIIYTEFNDEKTAEFHISEILDDGYRYVVSNFYGEDSPVIVRIPADSSDFLETDDTSLIKWAATNTVQAGFYQYIQANEETGQSGIKSIYIKTLLDGKNFEETFYVKYDKETVGEEQKDRLTVTSKSGKYTFEDNPNPASAYDVNQFGNFYMFLLVYPASVRFNTMTSDELRDLKSGSEPIFELIAETNDGKVLKYSYYRIASNSQYVVRETAEGEMVNSEAQLGNYDIVFDTTMEHINKLITALGTLVSGGKLNPGNEIF